MTDATERELERECPKCGREWPSDSEQAAAVEVVGGCIACQLTSMTVGDVNQIRDLAQSRKHGMTS